VKALLPKKNFPLLLGALDSRMEVVAPVRAEGVPVFASWNGQPLALESNPLIPPQEFLLPQRDVLFKYVQDCGRYSFEKESAKPRLILGIRPCDLKAVAVLDRIFGKEPLDNPYFERRRSTVLVGLNCLEPQAGCSCASFGAGPEANELSDLQLTDLGEDFLVETSSPAGVLILREHPEFFVEAGKRHEAEKKEALRRAREALSVGISPSEIKAAIEKADWDSLGRQCLSCGGCTFVCPICHCFTIIDIGVPDGERLRCRDSCILSGFSRMTSGVNPRKSQGERLRNWFLDKFEYIPLNTGLLGCVGCGR
jgi:sulfhydrogenase subunit beta (sulfur reductase)